MSSQITADLLDISRALREAKHHLAYEGDENSSQISSGKVALILINGAGPGLNWISPERRSRNIRKHLRELTGRKFIMLGKNMEWSTRIN